MWHYQIPEKIVRMIRSLTMAPKQGICKVMIRQSPSAGVLESVRSACSAHFSLSYYKTGYLVKPLVIMRQGSNLPCCRSYRTWTLQMNLVLLSQTFVLLQKQAARVGLKVSATSTNCKEVRIQPSSNTGNISSAGEILEQVTAFTYLGSLITTTGSTEENVEDRCKKTQAAFSILRPIWR